MGAACVLSSGGADGAPAANGATPPSAGLDCCSASFAAACLGLVFGQT